MQLESDLVEVDKQRQVAIFKNKAGTLEEKDFKFLHIVPRFHPAEFIRASGLSEASGYAEVDIHSLQHKRHANIWSLGDSAALPTSKTAAAIYEQTHVLKHNLMQQMRGE